MSICKTEPQESELNQYFESNYGIPVIDFQISSQNICKTPANLEATGFG